MNEVGTSGDPSLFGNREYITTDVLPTRILSLISTLHQPSTKTYTEHSKCHYLQVFECPEKSTVSHSLCCTKRSSLSIFRRARRLSNSTQLNSKVFHHIPTRVRTISAKQQRFRCVVGAREPRYEEHLDSRSLWKVS
ncbi:hypothetical protein RvY_05220 [Ramazzottius varieornatus]|uniref:Uncharacterized protein n=1 Tax=Ramazzottius varieornatus TaxID=947166 RepID=A0A1D1UUC5_RAMVA|nr:hypothetical protein RvY_05220 [Ramazzottius varieornatus]